MAARDLAQRVDEHDDEIASLKARFVALRARVTADLRRVQRALEDLDAAATEAEEENYDDEDR
ncbi:MAG: hypothetical protein ACRDIC_15265 [bacterium]